MIMSSNAKENKNLPAERIVASQSSTPFTDDSQAWHQEGCTGCNCDAKKKKGEKMTPKQEMEEHMSAAKRPKNNPMQEMMPLSGGATCTYTEIQAHQEGCTGCNCDAKNKEKTQPKPEKEERMSGIRRSKRYRTQEIVLVPKETTPAVETKAHQEGCTGCSCDAKKEKDTIAKPKSKKKRKNLTV